MGWPLPGKNQKLAFRTCSSDGENKTLIMSRSGVQVPPGPQAILAGEMIYLADVKVGVRVALVQIGRQGLSESYYSTIDDRQVFRRIYSNCYVY